jgi:hypothetical protein
MPTSIDEVPIAIHFAKGRILNKNIWERFQDLYMTEPNREALDIKNQPSIDTIKITTEESDLLKMGNQNL